MTDPYKDAPTFVDPYQTTEAKPAAAPEASPGPLTQLGTFLFGQHAAPVTQGIEQGLGVLGGALQRGFGTALSASVAPISVATTIAEHVPTGFIPNPMTGKSSDQMFEEMGASLAPGSKERTEWELLKTAANQDVLGGGNRKADYVNAALEAKDRASKEGLGGPASIIAGLGFGGQGSLGSAFAHSVVGALGAQSAYVQRGIAGSGLGAAVEPVIKSYAVVASNLLQGKGFQSLSDDLKPLAEQVAAGWGMNRIQDLKQRLRTDPNSLSAPELEAATKATDGTWSDAHALDVLTRDNQAYSDEFIVQMAGQMVTDPLMYETLGAGGVAALGVRGAKIVESGIEATTALQKLEVGIAGVRADPILGPLARAARAAIDPLGATFGSKGPVENAMIDLAPDSGVAALNRAVGPGAIERVLKLGREFGVEDEMRQALANGSLDQLDMLLAAERRAVLLDQGFGPELTQMSPDDLVAIGRTVDKGFIDRLSDNIARNLKMVMTPAEQDELAGRAANMMGDTVEYWSARIGKMKPNDRAALHYATYKRAEQPFVEAVAKSRQLGYAGDLPLDHAVLEASTSLDKTGAEALAASIRGEATLGERVAAWNIAARRYRAVSDIGHANGGEADLDALLAELEKRAADGRIMRSATPEELADPALKPIRDFLDTHVAGRKAFSPAHGLSPQPFIDEFGWPMARAQAYVDNAEMMPTKLLEPLREIDRRAKPELSLHASLEDLAASIDAHGGMEAPIIVWHDPASGATVVADGNHRLTVALEKGWDRVPVVVEVRPASEIAQAENIANIAHMQARPGAPTEGVMRPSQFFPEAADDPTKSLWRVGFKPNDDVGMGLTTDAVTGKYVVDRAPTLTHHFDATWPEGATQKIKNVMGQTIGEKIGKPVGAFERYFQAGMDQIGPARKALVIQRNFERTMVEQHGLDPALAGQLYAIAKRHARWGELRIQGMAIKDTTGQTGSLWDDLHNAIPFGTTMKNGESLTVNDVMQQLMFAAEGDMRVLGLGNQIAAKLRNRLMKDVPGFKGNVMGQITVDLYNKMRYLYNPSFIVQRVTDGPWFMLGRGIMPVGGGTLRDATVPAWIKATAGGDLRATRRIEDTVMAMTGTWRDTGVDQIERIPRMQFSRALQESLTEEVGGQAAYAEKIGRITNAETAYVANQMTKMMYARQGAIVKQVLEKDLRQALETIADPAERAAMEAEVGKIDGVFADIRAQLSADLGHVVDDAEVGQWYIESILNSQRRLRLGENGMPTTRDFISEMHWNTPDSLGELQSIHPDDIARELGGPGGMMFKDAKELRQAMQPYVDAHGIPRPAKLDMKWLEETGLRDTLKAHPDVIARAKRYFGGTWEEYWARLATPVESGGLDISPHYAKEAQDVIQTLARERGMDPWEYLSGVLGADMQGESGHVADLVRFLQAGDSANPLGDVVKLYRQTLDPSAVDVLTRSFLGEGKAAAPASVLPEPWRASPYAAKTELVPVSFLKTLPRGNKLGKTDLAALTADIKANGIKEPIPLEYSVADKAIRMSEGNHRLVAAEALGLDNIPVRFVRRESSFGKEGGVPVSGIAPDVHGYVPGDLRPSDIGVPVHGDAYDEWFQAELVKTAQARLAGSKARHPNADVEATLRGLMKYIKTVTEKQVSGHTRTILRGLVQGVDTSGGVTFSRSEALIQNLLVNRIREAADDTYMLAEMGTSRTAIMQSLNHPLFGLYPAAYMWGKVIPQTAKVLARNPFGLTYSILDVQRSIAIQREMDPNFDSKMTGLDGSAVAFGLGYLTPSLPWEPMEARTSPLVRSLSKLVQGQPVDPFDVLTKEFYTLSPERWYRYFSDPLNEVGDLLRRIQNPAFISPAATRGLNQIGEAGSAPAAPTGTPYGGPVSGAELGPVLSSSMQDLQRALMDSLK